MVYVGTRIPSILKHRDLTQAWLARRMGCTPLALWLVLGNRRRITPAFVDAACQALDLPPDVLFIPAPPSPARDAGADSAYSTDGDDGPVIYLPATGLHDGGDADGIG